jgi:hypothetical protein
MTEVVALKFATQKGDITLFDDDGGRKKSDVPFVGGDGARRTKEGKR